MLAMFSNASLVAQRLKRLACNAGDPGSISGSGRSPGEGNGNPLQYSCLENPMDGGAWWATVHKVAKSRIRLSDFTFTFMNNSCYCSTKLHKEFLPLAAPTKDLIKRLPWWSSG